MSIQLFGKVQNRFILVQILNQFKKFVSGIDKLSPTES